MIVKSGGEHHGRVTDVVRRHIFHDPLAGELARIAEQCDAVMVQTAGAKSVVAPKDTTAAVDSVTAGDATLTASPTTGNVVIERAAITGDVDIAAGSNTSVLENTANVQSIVEAITAGRYVPYITGLSYFPTEAAAVDAGNQAAIQSTLDALPYGGRARIAGSILGPFLGIATDVIFPDGVILEGDATSSKYESGSGPSFELVGTLIVPAAAGGVAGAGFTSANINGGAGTVAAAAVGVGTTGLFTLTSAAGWAGFIAGQLITATAGSGSIPANCQIISISTVTNPNDTLLITGATSPSGGAPTPPTAGTLTNVTAYWGTLLVYAGDYSGCQTLSADAGTTVAGKSGVTQCSRAMVSAGLRCKFRDADAHGGTLAAFDSLQTTANGTNQPTFVSLTTENTANKATTYQRQLGPYSFRNAAGDIQMSGTSRLIGGTVAFTWQCGGPQLDNIHFTDTTAGGPNVEWGAFGGTITNYVLDSIGAGTAYIEHLSAANNAGTNSSASRWIGGMVQPDTTTTAPVLLEDDTARSIVIDGLSINGGGGKQIGALVSMPNGSNPGTDISNVFIVAGSLVTISTAALFATSAYIGRIRNVRYGTAPQILVADGPTTSSSQPAAPTPTASTTLVMCGFAIPFTPTSTGNAIVRVTGSYGTTTGVSQMSVAVRYGTGGAPAYGAAVTGTAPPAGTLPMKATLATAQQPFPYSSGKITGLVLGTVYWLDLAFATNTGADAAQLSNLNIDLEMEIN